MQGRCIPVTAVTDSDLPLSAPYFVDFTYEHGKFLHRVTDDGTLESVCTTCFLTVSRTWGNFKLTEDELNVIEASHVCDQRRRAIHTQNNPYIPGT